MYFRAKRSSEVRSKALSLVLVEVNHGSISKPSYLKFYSKCIFIICRMYSQRTLV